MPCNNRRYQQHPTFGCHRAWRQANFPAESLLASFLQEHHDDDDATFHLAFQNKARASNNNEEEAHLLRMDVPGVKADRISIEEKNGEIEITALRMNHEEEVTKVYQEVFYLNPFRFDIDEAKATLTNGVLTLRIPKSEASAKTAVQVESDSVPNDLPSNIFQHTLDLPGVAASSLEVKLVEDRVHLIGKRSIGDKRVLVQRNFEVPPSMDTLQARALLQDGVFTFLAPIHKNEEGQLRTIFVQEEAMVDVESTAAMAEMKITDEENNSNPNSKKDETMKEDEMHVETVDDDAEAKETDSWEEIRPSSEEEKK